MTTGRINQVTILNPAPEWGEGGPRRGGVKRYRMAWASRSPPSRHLAPQREDLTATDSIAPTEFPRGQAATGGIGHRDRQPSPHVPPERRKPAADQALLGAVIRRVLPPNAW